MSNQTELPDITLLKSNEIGEVICQGLAQMYIDQPKFPVDYLSKWLLNYQATLQNKSLALQKIAEKNQLKEQDIQSALENEEAQKQLEILKQKKEQDEKNFRSEIENQLRHDQMLINHFPQKLKEKFNLSGAYIGKVQLPDKQIDINNDELTAHVDSEGTPYLKYVGSDNSHKFMINKCLLKEKGIVWQLFQEQEAVEEGETAVAKSNYLYVDNVVNNKNIEYFTYPKLGSFMVVPLVFKQYLNEQFIDDIFEKYKEYRANVAKRQLEREEKETALTEVIENKQNDGEDCSAEQAELDALDETYPPVLLPEIQSVQQQYVMCFDTLNQDRQISLENQKYLEDIVLFYAKSWEQAQFRYLKQDIDSYLDYSQKLIDEEFVNEFAQQIEEYVESVKDDHEEFKEDEKKLAYLQNVDRLNKIQQILTSSQVQSWLKTFLNFNCIKYQSLLQGLLILLGYKKSEINIPETNQLDWHRVSKIMNDKNFFKKLADYQFNIAKPQSFETYQKLSALQKRADNMNQEDIAKYNLGLSLLYVWFKTAILVRKQNVETRRISQIKQKQERLDIIAECESLKAERVQDLAQQIENLGDDEREAFNEQEFLQNWDNDHPLKPIPDEIIDDVDNDYDFE